MAVDVETTGTDPRHDRIIQIAAVLVEDGRVASHWAELVNPGRPIPPEIQRLTGITDDAVAGRPAAAEVIGAFARFIGGRPLVAHNAPFDLAFLRAAAGEAGDGTSDGTGRGSGGAASGGLSLSGPVYDTLELARITLPLQGSYSLVTLSRLADLAERRYHDALADAEAAAELFLWLGERLRRLSAPALRVAAGFLRGFDEAASMLLAAVAAAGGETGSAGPDDAGTAATGSAGVELATATAASDAPRFDRDLLVSWLAPGGRVAAGLGSYEPRPGQVAMMEAVAEAMAGGGTLVAEAGTGTGKSLAYLLPAALWAAASGSRVVISTHTINLQEQIWTKEAPLLQRCLPFALRVEVLKGRQNYLCLLKWRRVVAGDERLTAVGRRLYSRVATWLTMTPAGDRAEVGVRQDEEGAWRAIAADEGCIAERCDLASGCFHLCARERAAAADLLLINHSLLLADVATGGRVLPPYEHLVCDEAHHLPAVACDHLGVRVDERDVHARIEQAERLALQGASADLAGGVRAQASGTRAALAELFDALRSWGAGAQAGGERGGVGEGGTGGEGSARYRRFPAAAGGEADDRWQAIVSAAEEMRGRLLDLAGTLRGIRGDACAELEGWSQTLETTAADVGAVFSGGDVAWLELQQGWVAGTEPGRLQRAPVCPGSLLAERLFDRLTTCILTSATLSVNGSFDFMARELGVDRLEGVRFISVPPPFDYARQALLCVPVDFPHPAAAEGEFVGAAARFLLDLAEGIGGGILVLFTSNRMLRAVHARLKGGLDWRRTRLLAQGIDGGRSRILAEFQADPGAILLGAASFWEGIDVPGNGLRCVVLVRLPFNPPHLPLQEARLEEAGLRGEDGFRTVAVPEAVIRFKQGFGRLIRRGDDRGAVVVLDRRLISRRSSYGADFIESLPGPRLFTGAGREVVDAIRAWLGVGGVGEFGDALKGEQACEYC